MIIKKMEVEEKLSPVIDSPDESNSKKEKIITLLFPPESQPIEGKETRKDKNKPPTKVVVRRLPPRLTKETFIEEFSPLPPHDYFHFVRGDLNLGIHAFSRAYINFTNQEDIFSFKEKYDDYDLQDDKGRTYHAVVEFAAFQKIPKRNALKKKLSKAGTLESDPKYIEFLQKLEEAKNFINIPSEYFHETDNSALKTKVITTPLLEFLKKKRQKKIDLRNEIRQRKREAEREKKRKEEEKRKAEREKRKDEKKTIEKNKNLDEKKEKMDDRIKDKKSEDKGKGKEEKKDCKNKKNMEKESVSEERLYNAIPNDPAILEVVVRRSDKESKSGGKGGSKSNEETKAIRSNESDISLGKVEKKHGDFRSRFAEEKQRRSFFKRDAEDLKVVVKSNSGNRKGVPDEKGDNYSVGNCGDLKESTKKLDAESETKRHDLKLEMKETKSKFRYSEQRNRDREYRRKTSDGKNCKETAVQESNLESKAKAKEVDDRGANNILANSNVEEVKKSNSEPQVSEGNRAMAASGDVDASVSLPGRRKSLEMEREVLDTERKRSKSFHDISSSKELGGFEGGKKKEKTKDAGSKESGRTGDGGPKNGMDEESKKDPRVERRIRNKRMHPNSDCHPTCTFVKDRPSIEIYRPGMGKFSKQRLEQKKEETNSTSPTGTPYSNKSNRFVYKTNSKKTLQETRNSPKGDDKTGNSEVRTMTFNRSASREN